MLIRVVTVALEQLSPFLRRSDERGQTLVEYGLLLFFITLVVVAAVMLLGPTVSTIFQSVNDEIP